LYLILKAAQPILAITSNGGGATHIAKVTGQLKDLSSYTSDILMVSGGGGGGMLVGATAYEGADAGGVAGNHDNSADQSSGNAFGLGGSSGAYSGGGAGLYGGYQGNASMGGGAGSGSIRNSLVTNKKMVGYNVVTTSAEVAKTESVQVFSPLGEANTPKSGNGLAKIRFIESYETKYIQPHKLQMVKILDVDTEQYVDITIGELMKKVKQKFNCNSMILVPTSNDNHDYTICPFNLANDVTTIYVTDEVNTEHGVYIDPSIYAGDNVLAFSHPNVSSLNYYYFDGGDIEDNPSSTETLYTPADATTYKKYNFPSDSEIGKWIYYTSATLEHFYANGVDIA